MTEGGDGPAGDGTRDGAGGDDRLRVLARLFLRLGVVAFGGPAAHIAMLEDEVVERRGWMDRGHFLDLVGATNLIPGPNSTEMVMHVGYERAGGAGLAVAGACFILPAVLITGAFAWAYTVFGQLPEAAPFLAGLQPAVVAVILGAVWRLGKVAVKGWRLAVLGTAVAAAVLGGANEVVALVGGGLVGMMWLRARDLSGASGGLLAVPLSLLPGVGAGAGASGGGAGVGLLAGATSGVSLLKLGLFFLKVGAVLYGSGYVLVAFLEGDLVSGYGWLTQAQLLDAVALGQFTPGPVLSTATFIGYVVAGVPGAVVATVGIFLPSFAFVALANPWIPRLRDSAWMAAFLDSVNVSAVGLMAAVVASLGAGALDSPMSWAVGLTAAVAALAFRVNAAWIIAGGALVGGGAALLG